MLPPTLNSEPRTRNNWRTEPRISRQPRSQSATARGSDEVVPPIRPYPEAKTTMRHEMSRNTSKANRTVISPEGGIRARPYHALAEATPQRGERRQVRLREPSAAICTHPPTHPFSCQGSPARHANWNTRGKERGAGRGHYVRRRRRRGRRGWR